MTRRLLDTNTIGQIVAKNARVVARLTDLPSHRVCASTVSEGEVRYGLAKRDNAKLALAMDAFFETIEVVAWTRATAAVYGTFRAGLQRLGYSLAPLDMMIAAHALEQDAILVTSDRALLNAPGLTCEDWLAT